MDKMFKNMEDLIRSRNAQKEDELKKKFEERKRKEDELFEWMAKLNIKDHQKMKRETQGLVSKLTSDIPLNYGIFPFQFQFYRILS